MRYRRTEDQTPGDVLQALYDSEINFKLSCFWDGGIDWSLTSGIDGSIILAEGNERPVAKAVEALRRAAIQGYPDSKFAKAQREDWGQ